MKYTTEKEIEKVVESFENGAISREDWHYQEHMIVANHYLSSNDFNTAYNKMRDGIFKLLRSFEIDLNKEMPYHETLTIFWIRTVKILENLKKVIQLSRFAADWRKVLIRITL